MGLAHRIIPTLLARGDELVKGKQFDSWRSVGHLLQAARIHAARGVDELILLDIAATPEGRGPNLALVEKVAESQFTPLTVGGGVRSVDDVRDLLKAGADKVAICTAAFEDPLLVRYAANRFGRQAIVVAIDVRDKYAWTRCGTVPSQGAMRPSQGAIFAAMHFDEQGAGELLLTSIEREGTMAGYDLPLLAQICESVSIPVVAHGGCGTYEHMREALDAGASAVAAGAMFAFTDATPRGAARYLAKQGMEVRL